MARTKTEWEATFGAPAAILGLSLSAVAEWLGLRDMVVAVVMVFEGILEKFYSDTTSYIDSKQPGSSPWFPLMVKEFQQGHGLNVDNGIVKYETIDTDTQIVTVVSVEENDSNVMEVKVATTDEATGELIAFTNAQLLELKNYIESRRGDGVAVNLISRAGDTVTYALTVKYDKKYVKADIEAAIDAALETFRDNYNIINFDNVFYKSQMAEVIHAIDGVVSVQVSIDVTYGIGGGVSDVTEEISLPAGYFNWDGASTKTITAV